VTALAVTTAEAILAWIGLALGLVVALLVVALFNRVVRPVLEVDRYATHIRDAIEKIRVNVEGAGAIARTRELATAVPELALAYLRKLGAAD
jgi:hypothetical protein